jgi:hypothetical protein
MSLTPEEIRQVEAACRRLPRSTVQEEEAEVAQDPILILMSTVLSLNRRWYSHALPARCHFEQMVYSAFSRKSVEVFREFADTASKQRADWSALARTMWGMNEWDKARMLTELADYLLRWKETHAPGADDLDALRRWSASVSKAQFVGLVKGLGPRAFEQLMWYIEGKEAIKLDRHLIRFMGEVMGRELTESEMFDGLTQTAAKLEISPTALDARIWDYMQARKAAQAS